MNIRFVFFLFLFSQGYSQGYFKIPTDTNHYWRQFSGCFVSNKANRYDYQVKYFKDTLISGKTYNKYGAFGKGYAWPGFDGFCTSFINVGFLRQDTFNKTVFILDKDYVERPLYDFSKNPGDTMLSYNRVLNVNLALTVSTVIPTTLLDGSQRKTIWLSNNNCLVEGIGSVCGGLYGDNQYVFSNNVAEQLICFGNLYPFSQLVGGMTMVQYVCALVPETVGIEELEQDHIKVFPNPVTDILTVETDKIVSVEICNSLGQVVYSGTEKKINLSYLAPGLYILKTSNKIIKLIKI